MFPRKAWLGALGAALSLTGAASAQEGIVRISDRADSVPAQQASFGGHHRHGEYHAFDAGAGYDACPNCHGHGGHHCRGGHGCFHEHTCKNSPDHGYSVPAKWPLHRRGVQYQQYYPNAWYGTPQGGYAAAYPMVYQPTDTTQLGFYYQHVPFWQPNPGMLPPRPIPAQWHIGAPAVFASSFHNSPAGAHMLGHHFGHRHGRADCPDCYYESYESAPVTTPSATPTPLPEVQEAPPAPTPLEGKSISY
jgi:hypothetical protein